MDIFIFWIHKEENYHAIHAALQIVVVEMDIGNQVVEIVDVINAVMDNMHPVVDLVDVKVVPQDSTKLQVVKLPAMVALLVNISLTPDNRLALMLEQDIM